MLRDFRIALAQQTLWQTNESTPPWHVAFQDHVRKSLSRRQRITLNLSLLCRLEIRDFFARRLAGSGIEIGAQYVPTEVAPGVDVEYVDVLSNDELVSRYKLPADGLVPLAHVVDGHHLTAYVDDAKDFLIANHVLEHFDDPVGGVIEWLRVIRAGGLLFLTLPNYRSNAFDYKRTPERAPHFALDYVDPDNRPQRNRTHYEDMAMSLRDQDRQSAAVQSMVDEWISRGDRHHYHVYDEAALKDVLSEAGKASGNDLQLVDAFMPRDGFEILAIVRKLGKGSGRLRWLPKMVIASRTVEIAAIMAMRQVRAHRAS
ncbi:methyltransferase domain-containing protein [Mesorhizobium sp. M1E.F.Ca.ET.045.02.1.1]|uniref:methyltransferase domain-containing protein n=1 Tax=Mesorhizobium sp. M1E.F.Ca.ET.045.02.1.1 TaxID=2493672 RepID=UPI001679CCFB|nr:methyltransferase domain-containing protein [Mesorhizobium sp. M1E.F.Ca.ET.045.02.1.1]